jgi:hypothetical protein
MGPSMLGPRMVHAALAGVAALLVVHAAISGCDHDEVEHLHAAWLVSQGERPFVDFLEQHHPPAAYLLAPLAHALEGRPRALVLAARLGDLLLLAATIAAFSAMARRIVRDEGAAWPPLLLATCFLFLRNFLEVRPDPWMTALATVALWQWSSYLRGASLASAAFAGLALGGSIAFLQKAFAFAGLLALGTAVASGSDRAAWVRAARGAAILAAGAALPLGAMAFALDRAGMLRDFWFWNYTFNRFYYLKTHFAGPSAWATLGVAFAEDPVLWVAGLAGLWTVFARRLRVEPELALSSAVVVGLLGSLFESRWPFSHNLLLLQPALALLAVRPVEAALRSLRARPAVTALVVLLLLKVAVMAFVYDEGGDSAEVQRKLLAATDPTDLVAVPPPYHPIFRRDAFFFWYVPQNNAVAYLACCREEKCPPGKVDRDLRAWTGAPPRFVYTPAGEPSWAAYGFADHRLEYRSDPGGQLWERRTRTAAK